MNRSILSFHGDGSTPRMAGRKMSPTRAATAPADHDQPVGGEGHLAHQVAGHQHRAALRRQRLVEHQHRRVAEQRGGDAEPLLHAQ
jgi:hypothetical protein